MIFPERYLKFLTIVFFGIYLVIGLIIFKDYGVHVDEWSNEKFGKYWTRYVQETINERKILPLRKLTIAGVDWSDPEGPPHTLSHGPAWELVLNFINKNINTAQADSRPIVLTRHLFNFLLFYFSSICFFRLGLLVFKKYSFALYGVLLYVLHPRIFADSFYNTVDLAFLSFYTIALYTLAVLLQKKDTRSALWHAVACALAIDVRSAGLLLPILTVSFFLADIVNTKQPSVHRQLRQVTGVYVAVLGAMMFLFWPLLWSDPVAYFIQSLKGGVFHTNCDTPPGYNIFWIAMTTPPVYVFLFIIGFLRIVGFYLKNHSQDVLKYRMYLAVLFLFIAPISLSAVMKSRLYDGWRHHYFVYSSFALVCVFGIERLLEWAQKVGPASCRKGAVGIVAGMIVLAFLNTAYFMVRVHPLQCVYANVFAKRDPTLFNDYWMLSGRQAVEYVLAHDHRPKIYIGFSGWGDANIYILLEKQWSRFIQVENLEDADYVVVNYTLIDASIEKNRDLFYAHRVGGVPIMAIYKRKVQEIL